MPSTIGSKIVALLSEKGWSQAQLSERAGLGKGVVNDIVNHPDRRPRRTTVEKIASTLDVDAAWLMGEIDAPQMPSFISEISADDLQALQPKGAFSGWADLIKAHRGKYRAYQVPRYPGGATLDGGDLVLVDAIETPGSGDLVLVQSDQGRPLRYVAEPYLIGRDLDGSIFHELRGAGTAKVLGKVILSVSRP